MQTPQEAYERRKVSFDRLRDQQQRTINRLSNYRLGVFILGLAGSFWLYRAVSLLAGLAAGLVTLGLIVYLAVWQGQIRIQLKYSVTLGGLNSRGLERLAGKWTLFPNSGAEFAEEDHPYASDLDLFGQASVFQWINSAVTPLGRETLAKVLKHPPQDAAEISERQSAVTELAQNLAWRQRLQAEGMLVADQLEPIQPLLKWARGSRQGLSPLIKLMARVLPVITILTLALYAGNLLPWQVPTLLGLIQALLLKLNGKERAQALLLVYRYEASLATYGAMLQQVEELDATAGWLTERQSSLRDKDGRSAGEQIRGLAAIVERISNRKNMLFLVVNILTLWDYQCVIWLEQWKARSGRLLGTWLEVLAEIEALASLANIRFDHPEWVMPDIVTEQGPSRDTGGLSARKMGHPLLPEDRVLNDFDMKSLAGIVLITGSNMSGKSTFLRTVGSNLVLAYAGAPVCAQQFSCSRMNLWSCMRVSDNLQQSVSSFYAELLRVKRIVEAAKTEKPVCFLLDEIFKGTNSEDRHQGAKALINQLQKDGAFGMVSTHDLELGDLERTSNGRIKNYHFREYYQDQEIHFDYQLRRGISTTRNALHLIRLAGIELDEGV